MEYLMWIFRDPQTVLALPWTFILWWLKGLKSHPLLLGDQPRIREEQWHHLSQVQLCSSRDGTLGVRVAVPLLPHIPSAPNSSRQQRLLLPCAPEMFKVPGCLSCVELPIVRSPMTMLTHDSKLSCCWSLLVGHGGCWWLRELLEALLQIWPPS